MTTTTDHMGDTGEDWAARPAHRASDVLIALSAAIPNERVSVGYIVDGLQHRAFGFLMLILALPCCLPFLYGVPQVVSIPMLFISGQIAIGRDHPWLPGSLRRRSFTRAAFQDMAARAKRYVGWAESISQPRLTFLTSGLAERLFGVLMVVFCCSIAVPLPMTNTVPGIAVAIMAVGFIERDGLMVLGGALLGIVWVSFLVAVVVALFIYGIDLVAMIKGS
ncbi:MAG: exopolysaccharide biosynthesis protein [Alphaproteobacteria bacterium]